MEAFLRIGQLADATGVGAALLRTWESRYGLPIPARTGGGQRRYPAREVERVRAMKRLVDSGYRASEAARLVLATLPETPSGSEHLDRARDDVTSLLVEGDPAAIEMLDRLAARVPLEDLVEDVLSPIMREIGARWADGSISVAEEHAATWLVTSWVASQIRNLPLPLRPGIIVTAAPQGERHELGLTLFTVFLRRQGVRVLHLGSDLPPEDLAAMVAGANCDAVCLSVSMLIAGPGLNETITAVRARKAALPIFVGGAAAESIPVPDGVVVLGADMRAAAAQLIAALPG